MVTEFCRLSVRAQSCKVLIRVESDECPLYTLRLVRELITWKDRTPIYLKERMLLILFLLARFHYKGKGKVCILLEGFLIWLVCFE